MVLEVHISDSAQSELFAGREFHEPRYFQDRLALVDTPLPELPGVSDQPLPQFEDWYPDGVPFFANTWRDVLESLTEAEPKQEIPAHYLHWRCQHFVDNKMWGRAATTADAAIRLSYPDSEDWQRRRFDSNLAFVRLGIEESMGLPFGELQPDDFDVTHITPVGTKQFWRIRRLAGKLEQDDPEKLEPYLDIADGIFLECVLSYPDIGSFLHQMSKTYGLDATSPDIQAVYDRISHRDEAWLDKAGSLFKQHIAHQIEKLNYGRAGVLLSVGLRAGLLEGDYAREQFLRKYSEINLATAIPEHLAAIGEMVITPDTTYPPLTHFKTMVAELWLADDELRNELEAVMAHRELEVIQQLQANPGGLSDRSLRQIAKEASELIACMPDTDPQKQHLAQSEIDKKVEELSSNPESAGSYGIDNFLQQCLGDLSRGVITSEAFAQLVDAVEDTVLTRLQAEVNDRNLELVAGYLAPLCRVSQETVEQLVSKRFVEEAVQAIENGAKAMGGERDYTYFNVFKKALASSPYLFHKLYWEIYEEYNY